MCALQINLDNEYWKTNSIEHYTYRETNSSAACQKAPPPPSFIELESSLPCSQQPTTEFYLQPDEFIPNHPIIFNSHLYIIIPSTSRSSKLSVSFTFYKQNSVSVCATRVTCPALLISFSLMLSSSQYLTKNKSQNSSLGNFSTIFQIPLRFRS
jgi:hypothetical protein